MAPTMSEVSFGLMIASAPNVFARARRSRPTSIAIENFGTSNLSEDELLALVRKHFDLRPAAIIAGMDLLRPIYRPTAAYGHFGRDDLGVPWEMINKVDALRADASFAARSAR